MKNLKSLTLLSLSLFLLTSCQNNTSSNNEINQLKKENEELKLELSKKDTLKSTNSSNTQKSISSNNKEIVIGETIITDTKEVTINSISFEKTILPKNTNGYYNYYEAEEGKVYIYINSNIKNLKKEAVNADELLSVQVDYNKGFKYAGFSIVDDSRRGFTYSNITQINPLDTLGVHFLVDCPIEVEESNNPVIVNLDIDNTLYTYKIR